MPRSRASYQLEEKIARENGWFCYFTEDCYCDACERWRKKTGEGLHGSWVRCDENHPGAIPDLNRAYFQAFEIRSKRAKKGWETRRKRAREDR